MTLIEVAILLIATLAMVAALAPSISATIRRAETVQALAVMGNIDNAIGDSLGDMSYTYFTWDGAKNTLATKVQLIVGDGDTPRDVSATGSATWQQAENDTTVDFLEHHLILNLPGGVNVYNPPGAATEWRGAYLNGPMAPDPWGNRYMVNVQFLGPPAQDVVVYSAGPDEEIDSAYSALDFNVIPVDDDLFIITEN